MEANLGIALLQNKKGEKEKSGGWVGIFQFITHIPLLLSFLSRVSVFWGVRYTKARGEGVSYKGSFLKPPPLPSFHSFSGPRFLFSPLLYSPPPSIARAEGEAA